VWNYDDSLAIFSWVIHEANQDVCHIDELYGKYYHPHSTIDHYRDGIEVNPYSSDPLS
jgi:hypothetical protein